MAVATSPGGCDLGSVPALSPGPRTDGGTGTGGQRTWGGRGVAPGGGVVGVVPDTDYEHGYTDWWEPVPPARNRVSGPTSGPHPTLAPARVRVARRRVNTV